MPPFTTTGLSIMALPLAGGCSLQCTLQNDDCHVVFLMPLAGDALFFSEWP